MLVVAGASHNALGNQDSVVRAFDSRNGALLWQAQFDLAGDSDSSSDIVLGNGRAFVVGSSRNAGGDFDWVIRAYQAR